MVKFYKYPEIPDQKRNNSGNILFGILKAPTYKPLFGYINDTNNSAIVTFKAVKVDSKGNEVSRTTLSNSIITVDTTNNVYKLDPAVNYVNLLDECIYYFEIQNSTQLYQSEYFLVQIENIFFTCDNNGGTIDEDTGTIDETFLTI